jgi:hypothetical protein
VLKLVFSNSVLGNLRVANTYLASSPIGVKVASGLLVFDQGFLAVLQNKDVVVRFLKVSVGLHLAFVGVYYHLSASAFQ